MKDYDFCLCTHWCISCHWLLHCMPHFKYHAIFLIKFHIKVMQKFFLFFVKKLLTKSDRYVSINICHGKQSFPRRKRFQKKLLTNESGYDKISELPLRTTAKQHSSCGARGFDLWQINSNATLKIPRFSEKFKNKQVDRKIDKLPELTVNNAR